MVLARVRPSLTATQLVEFALAELQLEGIDAPSMAAALAMCRSVLAAGKAVHAGMHTIAGVVRCVVLDGDGFARGEFVLDVRCDLDVKADDVRRVARHWLDGDSERGVVRVRAANAVDVCVSWWRWRRRRRKIERAVRVALNRG